MNEKLSYAEMLDIPMTSSITVKPKKKKRFFGKKSVNVEKIKETLIEKVNDETSAEPLPVESERNDDTIPQSENELNITKDPTVYDKRFDGEEILSSVATETETTSVSFVKPKKIKKSRVIAVQLAIIGLLAAGIFLTNAIMPNSGINVFMNQVFGSESSTTDGRLYIDFKPEIPTTMNGCYLDGGVINVSEKSSVYSPCDGTVSRVEKNQAGKFSVTVIHSENFSTVISGLDYCYVENEGKVLSNVPVGYTKNGGATLCFYGGDGAVIANFTITDNTVIWSV